MSIYATFDHNGIATSFYASEIWGKLGQPECKIPKGAVEITDAQWAELLSNPGARKFVNGEVLEYTPPIPEPEPVVIVLPAVTLWERLTEDEADQVHDAMATQPVRTQRIFTTANTFRSDHELWPLLEQIANQLFGAERAAELLAS